MEYCSNGNLRDFLRRCRDVYNVDEQTLTADLSQSIGPKNLVHLAWQIAKGMTFLISRKVKENSKILTFVSFANSFITEY